jgi:hypothetical protein
MIQIDSVDDWKLSKAGTSKNCVMACTVIKNDDSGETEGIQGVPLYLQFNDSPKAKGFIEGFLRALGIDVAAQRYDLAAAAGKTITAFVENETYEGRVRNRVNHKYRANRS